MRISDWSADVCSSDLIAGIPERGAGDPSPATAYGVYMGIRAAARHRLGVDSLKGLRVAVQGVGHVGYYLCRHPAAQGAEVIVATDRKSGVSGKSVSVRVALGGRRINKKKTQQK